MIVYISLFLLQFAIAYDCTSTCDGLLWFTNTSGGRTDLGFFDLNQNETTMVYSGILFSADIAWGPDGVLYSATTGTITRIDFINSTDFLETAVFVPTNSANSLEIDCNGTMYMSSFSQLQGYNLTGTIISDITLTPPAFSQGDLAMAIMDGDLYFAASYQSIAYIYQVDIATGNTTQLGPVGPLRFWGLGNCNDTLYGMILEGDVYRINMNPFSVEFIQKATTGTVTGMAVRQSAGPLFLEPGVTTTATITTTATAVETTRNWIIPVIISSLFGVLLLFFWILCCFYWLQRKQCRFDPNLPRSYDSTLIRSNGQLILQNYFDMFQFTDVNVIVIQKGFFLKGKISSVLTNAVFNCSGVPIYIGDNQKRNLYPGTTLLLLNGFLPIENNMTQLYVYDKFKTLKAILK